MGAFVVRQVDTASGAELLRFVAPNTLANEGHGHVLRQLFPPYDAPMTFQLGVSGPTRAFPGERPNPGGGATFGPELTYATCTGDAANEGGCYTAAMRTSFGYARQNVSFTTALEADGGALLSPEVTFPNNHAWAPQDDGAWDLPWTPEIELPPPAWTNRANWEPLVGYPWQQPRKRCQTECDPGDPDDCVPSYMHQWDASGALDWLCDFRKIGGFPITLAFLIDASRNKLIAAAQFRAPLLLRPGAALHLRYQARIAGRITREFALRSARYAFGQTGGRYDAIYCRPLLAGAPKFTRRTTYADIAPHFAATFAAGALSTWNYVAGPPPRIESATVPQWTNSSGATLGPFGGLAVYGTVSGANELMWVTPINPPVSVPNGDTLRVPGKVRFQMEGV
ncbi:MAG: hypothetical protein IPM64_10725 [Phycisphaerales bacterium]|nr:hypothetical protein [Phycisphaerales bacterium]